MKKNTTINVKGTDIVLFSKGSEDYVSITDIARFKNAAEPKDIVKNWMRSRTTVEFLGLWEKIHNPNFKGVEFDSFMFEAGSNSFVLSPTKWIDTTNAIGIISKVGSGGGTYAHLDIALEFASWVSAEFKIYMLVEFKRLKADENVRLKLEWNLQRTLSKVNYRIHTDAIKENLIPVTLSKDKINIIYTDEADLLNMALFGETAKQWRDANPTSKGNMRDYATLEQLVVLSNLESINSVFINQGFAQHTRLLQLNHIAIAQMKSLLGNSQIKKIK
jgi:hypothetical protein